MFRTIKLIFSDIMLAVLGAVAVVLVALPLTAEIVFNNAKTLEGQFRWKKAGEVYQLAMRLNPLNPELCIGAADFFVRQSAFREDKSSWTERAVKLYERACSLNPKYAEYWYLAGKIQHDPTAYFKKAIELDPYSFRMNYLVGDSLVRIWGSLDEDTKAFTLDRLRFSLKSQPWYADKIYPVVMFFIKDFRTAQKVTADKLENHKKLYSYIVKSNLWQYRKSQKQAVDFFRKKEAPEEFDKERLEKLRRLEEVRRDFSASIDSNVPSNAWQGVSDKGNNVYKNGNMYWTGTMYAGIYMPGGKSTIKIRAKGEQALGAWPYMIVAVDGREIGECFVDSAEWKEYRFDVESGRGVKVISITFANDGGDLDSKKDRNLFVGEVKAGLLYEESL